MYSTCHRPNHIAWPLAGWTPRHRTSSKEERTPCFLPRHWETKEQVSETPICIMWVFSMSFAYFPSTPKMRTTNSLGWKPTYILTYSSRTHLKPKWQRPPPSSSGPTGWVHTNLWVLSLPTFSPSLSETLIRHLFSPPNPNSLFCRAANRELKLHCQILWAQDKHAVHNLPW